ncbi:MAG: hypothetical protein DCC88_04565 [Spirobacillus cienkowskii]|jgi:hypothetical protein|uniref:Uncharacterized protein n=1 Tax=Spirobacillus cienkowskii TaxID=495820 RepID=A0A369KV19_9BACT|nr:MAG: hypothetical protein DCC88_04565 [Spirobacillus cienkowskii]
MNSSKSSEKNKKEKFEKQKSSFDDETQKWFDRDDLQDLAKFGGDILKKTVATGMDVIKEVKDNFPKEATQLLSKGKDELLKGISQDVAKNMISFGIEKFFAVARQHRVDLSVRLRKSDEPKHTDDDKK